MPKKYRILHVDDEEDTLKVVQTILEKEGYTVVSAKDSQAALKAIDSNPFDLILLDIMMPDVSGWELFTRITKINPDFRVVFLTVLESTSEKIKFLKEQGIKDYITKPFDKKTLVARVKKAIAA